MLSHYMVDYTKTKIPAPFGPLDADGVPLYDPKFIRLKGKPVYHPIVIIQYGLACHDRSLSGDQEAERAFIKCATWIQEHAIVEPGGRFLAWYYPFRLLTPPVAPPWLSGMAQGQALSLLARLFQKTESVRTSDIACSAARSFLYSLKEGGVVSKSVKGSYFIEEIAHSPATHILNGSLYGLFGLYEYLQVFNDVELQAAFEKCLHGIEEMLPAFDMGWWSRYSLGIRLNMATPYYHGVHIRQLKHLGMIFERPLFDEYARCWEQYQQSSAYRIKRKTLGLVEVNINRLLGLTKINWIKYRRVSGMEY